MSKGTISSLNVKIFQWLKKKQFPIYMLQEAHCTKNSFRLWSAEWGYTALFNGVASNRAGVATLFNNNFSSKILKQFCDKEGRYIIIDLEVGELTLTICNIYSLNKDYPSFFEAIFKEILSFRCDEIIFGSDFNLVWTFQKTKRGEHRLRIRSP